MNKLHYRVRAQNLANEITRIFVLEVSSNFRPFIGKKVRNIDGSFSKKFSVVFQNIVANIKAQFPMSRIIPINSKYSLGFTCEQCINIPESACVYEENDVYVGKFSTDGNLEELTIDQFDPKDYPVNISEEDIKKARAIVKEKEEELSKAKKLLQGFGEYD